MPDQPPPEPTLRTFEQSIKELEQIVHQLENTDVPLEESLTLFERAIGLSGACRKQLEEAETRVEVLVRRRNGVQPVPFRDGSE